jgi:broad specificity phosphatase PhoE
MLRGYQADSLDETQVAVMAKEYWLTAGHREPRFWPAILASYFVLVRHGESEGNVVHRRSREGDHSDFTDEFKGVHSSQYRLTRRGRQQAAQAGDWIRRHIGPHFHRYYVSEYTRAVETADLLALPDARWFKTSFLRERDAGDDSQALVSETAASGQGLVWRIDSWKPDA